MTVSVPLSVALVWIHFFSDFVLQSDKMAQNKSKHWGWLALHVFVYSLPFTVFFGPIYSAINYVAHFLTDAVTSRITSRLWAKKKVHWFFVVIGFDQAVHITTLVYTYMWLQNKGWLGW